MPYAPWNVRGKNMEAGAPCQLRPWCDGSLQDCDIAIITYSPTEYVYLMLRYMLNTFCRTLDKSLFTPSDTTKQYFKDGRKRVQGNKESLKKTQVYPKLFGKKVLWLFCGAVAIYTCKLCFPQRHYIYNHNPCSLRCVRSTPMPND